ADFRLTASESYIDGGRVNYTAPAGGTFAGVAAVTKLVEIPTYLRSDPFTDAAHLYRMQPLFQTALTQPTKFDVTRQSWVRAPGLLIPRS
ncbi:MAG: hypothetical protein ACXVGA_02180, partial [Mycobacteriaceae bacterium]